MWIFLPRTKILYYLGLVFQSTTGICQTDIRNKFVRQLILHLLICLNHALHCEQAMLSLLYNYHFESRSTKLAELYHFALSYAWCTKYVSCCFASDCESLSVNATTYKFSSKTFENLSYFSFTIVLCP